MGRKKRSEKEMKQPAVIEKPKKAPAAIVGVGEVMRALCPVCGRAITDRAVKVGGLTVGKVGYFESIAWDKDKPFGVAAIAGGRGSFSDWRYIGPDEALDLFEPLRERLLAAILEWAGKGWLEDRHLDQLRQL